MGQTKPEEIDYAFRSGVSRLPQNANLEKPHSALACDLASVKRSIESLRLANHKIKQRLVDACAYTVMLDNKTTPGEADLLRTVAILLDCPMPPFLYIHSLSNRLR